MEQTTEAGTIVLQKLGGMLTATTIHDIERMKAIRNQLTSMINGEGLVKTGGVKGYEQGGTGEESGEQEVVDYYHYHEFTDRIHLIVDIIDRHLMAHPIYEIEDKLKKLVDEVTERLVTAYQLCGGMGLRDE